MCQYAARVGSVSNWHTVHHARYAMSGLSLAFIEATAVSAAGRITHGCTGLWHDDQISGLARIAAMYQELGTVPGIQLAHAGWKASAARPVDGAGPLAAGGAEPAWQSVGPSALPCKPGWPACREMDPADIESVKHDWRAAVRRALRAGFRVIEIHGAHGYLIHSFLSPLSNRRSDAYGGSLEGRMRLALEIAQLTRAEWPSEWPVFFRVSSTDDEPGGWTLEDTVALACRLRECGIDVIDCSSGGLTSLPPSGRLALPQGFQVPYAARVRREARVATMAVGLITEATFANNVIGNGEADLIALGRQFMVSPGWTVEAALELGHRAAVELLPAPYRLYIERRGWRRPERPLARPPGTS